MTVIISPNLKDIYTMLRRLLDESASHFWWPAEFENVPNPNFENLKHLQNPLHLLLNASISICEKYWHPPQAILQEYWNV